MDLCRRLQEIGIETIDVPTVEVQPPESFEALDSALRDLERYHWVIFTSANGVKAFFARRSILQSGEGLPTALRWAAIGPATATALAAHGIAHAWIPTRYLSEALAKELPDVAGRRILRIQPETTLPNMVEHLRARGAVVDEVAAYRVLEGPSGAEAQLREAWIRRIDGVIFTSASTVRGFARLLAATGSAPRLSDLQLIAIGPVTAAAIEAFGWHAALVAEQYDVDGIIHLIQRHQHYQAADAG